MMLEKKRACLMVIDVQTRLLPGIPDSETLVERCTALVGLANELEIPVFGSEQYPDGVGPMDDTLKAAIGADNVAGKTHFSCVDAPECADLMQQMTQDQIVICGMESHACVLQSALSFKAQGKEVFVVADAIASRHAVDTEFAIARMREEGIKLVTCEMVGFEWLRRSDTAGFKTFSKAFLR